MHPSSPASYLEFILTAYDKQPSASRLRNAWPGASHVIDREIALLRQDPTQALRDLDAVTMPQDEPSLALVIIRLHHFLVEKLFPYLPVEVLDCVFEAAGTTAWRRLGVNGLQWRTDGIQAILTRLLGARPGEKLCLDGLSSEEIRRRIWHAMDWIFQKEKKRAERERTAQGFVELASRQVERSETPASANLHLEEILSGSDFSDEDRLCIRLYREGHSVEEIARSTSIPKWRVYRALTIFKAKLGEQ